MSFPPRVSFTITNACNLRCRMCGQWSENGYIRKSGHSQSEMQLADWKRLVDEMAGHDVSWVLIRGGEPFLFPGFIQLLEHLRAQGISVSIDTNGTMLKQYAADLVRLDGVNMTISVDGPEEVHDAVRGVKGSFRRIEEGLATLREQERISGRTIERVICFTVSPYSLRGLGDMPEVARRLDIPMIHFMPYYYFPEAVGKKYEEELQGLGGHAFSWRGFQHEGSGVDFEEFLRQLRKFKATLGSVKFCPFMELSEDEYRTWFSDATTPVRSQECWNLDGLIDIQPDGEANFCVDFPDYSFGNVRNSTIEEIWNGERAERFREFRRKQPLAVCHRCGAKYISAPPGLASAPQQSEA
jgi:MoaA/NifB/PqqE/SkfB family radical SAM enzyme